VPVPVAKTARSERDFVGVCQAGSTNQAARVTMALHQSSRHEGLLQAQFGVSSEEDEVRPTGQYPLAAPSGFRAQFWPVCWTCAANCAVEPGEPGGRGVTASPDP
jgi:hypothetical protein